MTLRVNYQLCLPVVFAFSANANSLLKTNISLSFRRCHLMMVVRDLGMGFGGSARNQARGGARARSEPTVPAGSQRGSEKRVL